MGLIPTYPHKISDVIIYFSGKEQNKEILEMAMIAQDIFEIKEISFNTTEIGQVTLESIKTKISEISKLKWNEKLSDSILKKLETKKSVLQKNFGETSYVWAWVFNQLGQKVEAKKILHSLFAQTYTDVLSLREVSIYPGRGPLSQMEPIFNVLEKLCEGKELIQIKDQMSKAKQHISNLPQSNINT
jgi:hypothetical protein